jgi:hypothetical protein
VTAGGTAPISLRIRNLYFVSGAVP